mgnify:CR=1 FL=1
MRYDEAKNTMKKHGIKAERHYEVKGKGCKRICIHLMEGSWIDKWNRVPFQEEWCGVH